MLSQTLHSIINELDGETVTLRDVMQACGQQGLLVLCALSTLPFLIPVSIPGVSTVFGAAIVLIACAVFLNRQPWLPRRVLDRPLDGRKLVAALHKGLRLVERLDRWLHPRLLPLSAGLMQRVNSLGIVLGGVLLMAPFGLIPFSNTAPAVAILLLATGLIQRDGLVLLLGYLALVATLVYFGVLIGLAWTGGAAVLG